MEVSTQTHIGLCYGVYMITPRITSETLSCCRVSSWYETGLDLVGGLVFIGAPVVYDGWVYVDSMDPKAHGGTLLVLGVYLDSSTEKVKMRQTVL